MLQNFSVGACTSRRRGCYACLPQRANDICRQPRTALVKGSWCDGGRGLLRMASLQHAMAHWLQRYCGASGTCGGAWLWWGRGLSVGCADGTAADCCCTPLCTSILLLCPSPTASLTGQLQLQQAKADSYPSHQAKGMRRTWQVSCMLVLVGTPSISTKTAACL